MNQSVPANRLLSYARYRAEGFVLFMRGALFCGLLLTTGALYAQDANPPPSLFMSERPDVMIVVRRSSVGSDLVTINVMKDNYSKELLLGQIKKLGELLQTEPTIASIGVHYPNSKMPGSGYMQAEIGVRGLVDRPKAVLGLEVLSKAFLGVPEPNTIDVLNIQYGDESPSTNILSKWSDAEGNVKVQAQADPLVGIEYRIKLNSQDPSKIHIPEGIDAKVEEKTPEKPPAKTTEWWIWPVAILAALALGALVYSLLLRPRPVRRPR